MRLNHAEQQKPELINLLKRMLDKDPDKRAGIYEIISDPWVTDSGLCHVDLDLDLTDESY